MYNIPTCAFTWEDTKEEPQRYSGRNLLKAGAVFLGRSTAKTFIEEKIPLSIYELKGAGGGGREK